MKVRFQADADVDARIVRGLKRRDPGIVFRTADDAQLRGLTDLMVLSIAAKANRVLVSHDERTMPSYFAEFVQRESTPGVIIIPQQTPIGLAIDELLLIWSATDAEEWRNRLVWAPL